MRLKPRCRDRHDQPILFVGSDKGGQTAAVLYTLVASCKRLRIDPFAYLREVFTRLPEISGREEFQ